VEQRYLDFTSLSLTSLLSDIRTEWFSTLERPVEWRFCCGPSLARIETSNQVAIIQLHLLLNHFETPWEVFSMIFKHELLHLIHCSTIENPIKNHSEAFWLDEQRIAPERMIAWRWLFRNFYRCLQRDEEAEHIKVKKNWMYEQNRPRITILEPAHPTHHHHLPDFLRLSVDV
jgi:hypothetical protein